MILFNRKVEIISDDFTDLFLFNLDYKIELGIYAGKIMRF